MLELRSTDMLKRAQELPDNLLQQPRGLYVPVKAPPGELSATPGVADAAERSAQRARLIDAIRVQPGITSGTGCRGRLSRAGRWQSHWDWGFCFCGVY